MADYKVNIGPCQADFPEFGYDVNIGPDQDGGNVLPEITDQSSSQTVFYGQEVNLFVTATGEPTPSYQWYKNDVIIAGETDSTMTIYPTSTATYRCRVYNIVGEDWSDPIVLTILENPNRWNLFSIYLDQEME